MGDLSSPYIQPPPASHKANLPIPFYGLIIIGTAAILLVMYNLIFIKWCSNRRSQDLSAQRPGRFIEATASSHSLNSSTFKFRKDDNMGSQGQGSDYECAVCLSVFEEGEEIRQLPGCNHSFHAPCIDMWLFSHSDCPLCRARVVAAPPPFCRRHHEEATPDNSQDNLLGANLHFMPFV